MSRFQGSRYQGALRDHKKRLRVEAEQRNALARHEEEQRRLREQQADRIANDPFGGMLETLLRYPLPKTSLYYDNIDEDTGDITINGATLVAGVDF